MIDRTTIDKVIDTANIVEVVSDFVTLKKRGVNYVGLCPFHDDKTPSFYVSPAKNLCKCFACGKGGNAVHFIMEHEQLSFPEAIRWLAKKYHIEIEEKEMTAEEIAQHNARESLFVVNEFARDYFVDTLHHTEDGRNIGLAYFRQRGIRDDIIQKFQLGYSLNRNNAFAKEAESKGYKKEFLVKTGLCIENADGNLRDRFWGRVVFPWHTVTGKVVAFNARVLQSNAKVAKYVNSPESEIYLKRKELYGIYFAKQAIIKQDKCYLVEGQMDVISMHQSGVENVVASSGTSLTLEQIRLIHRFTKNVTLLYDGDSAGIHASLRGIDMLLSEGMNIKVLLFPDGEDPDSFSHKHNATEFQKYIQENEEDFIRFKARLLLNDAKNDPIKRGELIADISQSIGQIPDRILRFTYTQECASILNVDERLILNESEKYVKRRQEALLDRMQKEREEQAKPANPLNANPPIVDTTTTFNGVPVESVPIPSNEDFIPIPEREDVPPPPEEMLPPHQTFILASDREKAEFYVKEKELVKLIIRYGELPFCKVADEDGQEKELTLIEFISADLQQDDLQFHNPLHRQVLTEGMVHVHDKDFSCSHYFLTHPNQELSRMAADFMSERYELSRRYEMEPEKDRIRFMVPQYLLSFKIAFIKDEMKHTLSTLTSPDVTNNKEEAEKIMAHYHELSQILNDITKRTSRVVM